jgi:hypothetical protein
MGSDQTSTDNEPSKSSLPPEKSDQVAKQGLDKVSLTTLRERIEPIMARTMLDAEACRQVMANLFSSQEQLLKEQAESASTQPAKLLEPIKNVRKATPCSSKWESMPGGEQFRLCEQCHLHIYNLKGLDNSEAENLVFQREGVRKFTFYKRKDGRYLTKDCPVAVKRATRMLMSASAVAIMVVGSFLLVALSPHKEPALTGSAAASPGDNLDQDDSIFESPDSQQSAQSQNWTRHTKYKIIGRRR